MYKLGTVLDVLMNLIYTLIILEQFWRSWQVIIFQFLEVNFWKAFDLAVVDRRDYEMKLLWLW